MAFAQYNPQSVPTAPPQQHIINVNLTSKWNLSADGGEDSSDEGGNNWEDPNQQLNQIDISVPASWKQNNGTCVWDRVPPIMNPTTTTTMATGTSTNMSSSIGSTRPSADFNPIVGAPPQSQHLAYNTSAPIPTRQQVPSLAQVCTTSLSAGKPTQDGAPVEIQPYNPQWAIAFEEEANQIKAILGPDIVVDVVHIGSTSVPGLPAKPIIDMVLVVKKILSMDSPINRAKMEALGYEYKGENGIPFRRFYTKHESSLLSSAAVGGPRRRTHHLHTFELGNAEIGYHIHFRDYLSSDYAKQRGDFTKYTQLKLELANKHPNDMSNYSLGKSKFISSLLAFISSRTHFHRELLRNCFTEDEWTGYRTLMGGETENTPNHYQFVLLYQFEVVCAANVFLDKTNGHFQILRLCTHPKWHSRKSILESFEKKLENMLFEWNQHQQVVAKLERERNTDLGRYFSEMSLSPEM